MCCEVDNVTESSGPRGLTAELRRRLSELEQQLTEQLDANAGLEADSELLLSCLQEQEQQYKVRLALLRSI